MGKVFSCLFTIASKQTKRKDNLLITNDDLPSPPSLDLRRRPQREPVHQVDAIGQRSLEQSSVAGWRLIDDDHLLRIGPRKWGGGGWSGAQFRGLTARHYPTAFNGTGQSLPRGVPRYRKVVSSISKVVSMFSLNLIFIFPGPTKACTTRWARERCPSSRDASHWKE